MEAANLFTIQNPNNIAALPVSYLLANLQACFLEEIDGFKQIYIQETKAHGLKEKIDYCLLDHKITEVASINQDRQISLYENFNQYLWCTSYALLSIYVEGYEIPRKTGQYMGTLDDNRYVEEGYWVFSNGLSLLREYQNEVFCQIPNPKTIDEKEYALKANGIYCYAMRFVMLHEFAHHYYGHTKGAKDLEAFIQNETIADEYALKKIVQCFSEKEGRTQKFGIIAAMVSLLLMQKENRKPEEYQDLAKRLFDLINSLALPDDEDDLWGIASFGIKLWAVHIGKILIENKIYDTHKELFLALHAQLS